VTARRATIIALLASFTLPAALGQLLAQDAVPPAPIRQTPTPATKPASSPVVRINAVATDSRGRSILDLKASDFELQDDGVIQPLSSVELRTVSREAPDLQPVLSADDERRAAQHAATRVFALFLDEFNVAPGLNSARVREAAARFMAEQVRPGDLVRVLKPMDPVGGLRFTRDRAESLRAIDTFEGRKGDYAARTPFEEQYLGRTPGAVTSARAQIVTTALRELTMKIGELQAARGALVLISEGFVRGRGSERRRLPDWQSLARAASHFNLPIYTLDPGDPVATPPATDDPESGDPEGDTLRSLAAQTGGEATTGGRELLAGLARVSRDLDDYYALTYQPTHASDGRFHPISVRTLRKGARLRVPSGYWSPLSSEWRTWLTRDSGPVGTPRPTRTLRRSRLIETWYGFEPGEGGGLQLVFTWEPSAAGSALRVRPHVVMLKASTPDGSTVVEQEVQAAGPQRRSGLAERSLFAVSPGRMHLDLSVRAADGSVLDASAQDVDVPAIRGVGPVLLQPQLLRARTARDFRALLSVADAGPSASRTFSRSERLLIRVPAYNPDGAPVKIGVAVSNMKGTTIRTLERVPDDGAIPKYDLPLAFLAPGEYGIDVTVTSATGTARQMIRFRLTG
jgi:VWFA-related protein